MSLSESEERLKSHKRGGVCVAWPAAATLVCVRASDGRCVFVLWVPFAKARFCVTRLRWVPPRCLLARPAADPRRRRTFRLASFSPPACPPSTSAFPRTFGRESQTHFTMQALRISAVPRCSAVRPAAVRLHTHTERGRGSSLRGAPPLPPPSPGARARDARPHQSIRVDPYRLSGIGIGASTGAAERESARAEESLTQFLPSLPPLLHTKHTAPPHVACRAGRRQAQDPQGEIETSTNCPQ